MKPPNLRKIDFDIRDLDLIEKIKYCSNCKWCYDSDEGFICSKHKYKILIILNEYEVCDSYEKLIEPPNLRVVENIGNEGCPLCQHHGIGSDDHSTSVYDVFCELYQYKLNFQIKDNLEYIGEELVCDSFKSNSP